MICDFLANRRLKGDSGKRARVTPKLDDSLMSKELVNIKATCVRSFAFRTDNDFSAEVVPKAATGRYIGSFVSAGIEMLQWKMSLNKKFTRKPPWSCLPLPGVPVTHSIQSFLDLLVPWVLPHPS